MRMKPANLITHLTAPLPLIWLAVRYFTNDLSANPIQEIIQRLGDIAIIYLLLSLAGTPVNTLFGWAWARKLRKPLGLYAFGYAALHMLALTGLDYGFNWQFIILDHKDKPYIYVGLAALIILTALAATSFKRMKRVMGKNWKRLHQMVYIAGLLVAVHVAWAVKGDLLTLQGDIWKPLLAWIVLLLELAVRLPFIKRAIQNGRDKRTRQQGEAAVGQPLEKGLS